MYIHYFQYVPFEDLGSIEPVLREKGYSISVTQFFNNEMLPSISDLDWLIVMGGPMGVQDELQHPWLKKEKQFIKDAISAGKVVIGICLGAQLIAEVLGANVYKNKYREIGWFNIAANPQISRTILKDIFPPRIEVFHWHGDTFDIPNGAIPIASSEATQHQGFILDNHVLALQFHLETTSASAKALIDNCRDELDDSKYVQDENELLAKPQRFNDINHLMSQILNLLENNQDNYNL